jgi:hypothetical protein
MGRLELVEQTVRGATQPVGEFGSARGVGFRLQRVQAPPRHSHAQAQASHPVALAAQGHLQAAVAVASLMAAKYLDQRVLPRG